MLGLKPRKILPQKHDYFASLGQLRSKWFKMFIFKVNHLHWSLKNPFYPLRTVFVPTYLLETYQNHTLYSGWHSQDWRACFIWHNLKVSSTESGPQGGQENESGWTASTGATKPRKGLMGATQLSDWKKLPRNNAEGEITNTISRDHLGRKLHGSPAPAHRVGSHNSKSSSFQIADTRHKKVATNCHQGLGAGWAPLLFLFQSGGQFELRLGHCIGGSSPSPPPTPDFISHLKHNPSFMKTQLKY